MQSSEIQRAVMVKLGAVCFRSRCWLYTIMGYIMLPSSQSSADIESRLR